MANAQQSTRRTKHVDVKKFALLDWVEQDLVIMKRVKTSDNAADGLTKSLGRILHYRHFDYIMGHHKQQYTDKNNTDHRISHTSQSGLSMYDTNKSNKSVPPNKGGIIHRVKGGQTS